MVLQEMNCVMVLTNDEMSGYPDMVKILPVGKVNSEKGDFIVDMESFQAMKAEMQRRGIDIVIDYEHQTLKDVQAPAGGWVKDLVYTPEAIVAKVEWTPKAREYLNNKEYRYLSPVVLTRKSDSKAVVLHSLALTNIPAINRMFAIVNSVDFDTDNLLNTADTGGKKMDLQQIKELLGLPADAPEEIPSTYGSASGFFVIACIKIPVSTRPAPVHAATITFGRRSAQMILIWLLLYALRSLLKILP